MKNTKYRFLLAGLAPLAVAAGLIAGVACGGDDDEATPTTAPTQAPAAYPARVTDLLGRSVEIKARPKAVVVLSPTAAEFTAAVGGTIVGRASSVDFPESAKQAKEVGTAYQPNLEAILALKPDLVVADSIIHAQPQLRKPLEDMGVTIVFAGADSYQKVLDGLALMGKIFDAQEKVKALSTDIAKARDDAKAAIAGRKASAVAIISDRDRVLYAAKPGSYAGDVLAQLGVTNPAAAQPDSGPFPGYTTLAPEKLVEYNPDFIFTITPAPPPAPRLSASLEQIPPFKSLKAMTQKHIVELNVDHFLQAPGPRIIDAFKAIATAVSASTN